MSDIQTSSVIEYLDPRFLKSHPKNESIYGEDGFRDLIDSIRQLGVMQALYVTNENIIISGHRRWKAASVVRGEKYFEVPVIRVKYNTELDERQAIIEFNRYRVKTGQQLWNEGRELLSIEADKAQARMLSGESSNPEMNSSQGRAPQVRDIIASTIGLGKGAQWDKLKYVADHKPQILSDIKPDGISIHKAWAECKRDERLAKSAEPKSFPTGRYDILYIDPPWQYNNSGFSTAAAGQYPTMPYEDIAALDVVSIAEPNSIIFLWVTNPFLSEGLRLLNTWGFAYKTNIVWIKPSPMMGHYVKGQHELLLLAVRGSGMEPYGEKPSSVLQADRQDHSQKPIKAYELIESMYPNATRVELFARIERVGWDSWGNQ